MSKAFAEKIIEFMVDESGHCGERGLSPKQFFILSELLAGLLEGELARRLRTNREFVHMSGRM